MFNLLEVNGEALTKSLDILWQGLLAVVIVVGIVIGVTYLMQYISKRISDKKEKSALPTDAKSDENTDVGQE